MVEGRWGSRGRGSEKCREWEDVVFGGVAGRKRVTGRGLGGGSAEEQNHILSAEADTRSLTAARESHCAPADARDFRCVFRARLAVLLDGCLLVAIRQQEGDFSCTRLELDDDLVALDL